MSLLTSYQDRVLRLTLNRPDKRNALDSALSREIVDAIESVQRDKQVGAVLIDAQGSVFCAGMDLAEAVRPGSVRRNAIHEKLFTMGATSLKPIVVCAQGSALGGGLGLVAQAHVAVAVAGTKFGLPEIKIGLWPFLIYRSVEAALGARRTQELSLTGRVFSAEDAQQWGLVHHIASAAEAAEQANAIAISLATSSPQAIAAGMQYVRASRRRSWKEAGRLADSLRGKLMTSPDFKEGYASFKEKREPRWPSMPKKKRVADNKK